MQRAEETTVYTEADPQAEHSQVEVDVEDAPRPTVVDEIRATARQLKRLQGNLKPGDPVQFRVMRRVGGRNSTDWQQAFVAGTLPTVR